MLYRLYLYLLQCLGFDPRGIFHYYDGRKWRHADPMDLVRKLWSTSVYHCDMPGRETGPVALFDPKRARSLILSGNDEDIVKGYAIIAAAVRQIFDVKPLSEGGLAETECEVLLARFEDYRGDLKKNTSGSPTTVRSTDGQGESPTNASSDSTSTSTVKTYELPDTSDLEQQWAENPI